MTVSPASALAPDAPASEDAPFFDAQLSPRRALSPRGFRLFAGILIAAATVLLIPMLLRGWWVAAPYLVGDVAFLLILFHRHNADRAACEHIRVDRSGVAIMELDRRRRLVSSRSLPLYGLTLERVTDPDYGLRALRLSLRGRAVEVARHLAPAEKAAFADEFERALRSAGCAPWRRDTTTPALARAR